MTLIGSVQNHVDFLMETRGAAIVAPPSPLYDQLNENTKRAFEIFPHLLTEPVRIDAGNANELERRIDPLIERDKKIRVLTRPEWYLVGNSLNEARTKLDEMEHGKTPTKRAGGK